MTTKDEIEKQLAEARAKLEEKLEIQLAARDNANTQIKSLRELLAEMPRLHVPRKRKAKASEQPTCELLPGEKVDFKAPAPGPFTDRWEP